MKKIAAVLPISALLALNLWSLNWMPRVGMDDTLISAPAHNFIQRGRYVQTMTRTASFFSENERVYGRILLAGLTATGYLIGPTKSSDRLWSFCMMLVALTLLWRLARASLGRFWGIAAATLCIAEPMFFSFSHIPRPEMTLCVFYLLGIFCGMKALEHDSPKWLLLAGLCGSLAIDVHLSGMILAPSLGLSLILTRRKSILSQRQVTWFAAGVSIGILWYIAWHVLPDPQLFFRQYDYYSFKEGFLSNGLYPFLLKVVKEYRRYAIWFFGPGPKLIRLLEAALIVFGIIFQARSRNLKRRYLSVATISLAMIQALMVNRKVVYYLMPLYPLFVLHAAAALRSFDILGRARAVLRRWDGRWVKALSFSGLIGLFAFYSVQDLIKLHRNQNTDYERYVAEITSVVPRDAVVAGSPSLWYGLGQRNNLVANLSILWTLNYDRHNGVSTSTVSELVRREKIQFIVVEPFLRNSIDSQGGEIESSLRRFLESDCRLVKAFKNKDYAGIGECPEGELTEVFAVRGGGF